MALKLGAGQMRGVLSAAGRRGFATVFPCPKKHHRLRQPSGWPLRCLGAAPIAWVQQTCCEAGHRTFDQPTGLRWSRFPPLRRAVPRKANQAISQRGRGFHGRPRISSRSNFCRPRENQSQNRVYTYRYIDELPAILHRLIAKGSKRGWAQAGKALRRPVLSSSENSDKNRA